MTGNSVGGRERAAGSGVRYFLSHLEYPGVPTTLHRIVMEEDSIEFERWTGTTWVFDPLLVSDRVKGGTDFTEIDEAEAVRFLGAIGQGQA